MSDVVCSECQRYKIALEMLKKDLIRLNKKYRDLSEEYFKNKDVIKELLEDLKQLPSNETTD